MNASRIRAGRTYEEVAFEVIRQGVPNTPCGTEVEAVNIAQDVAVREGRAVTILRDGHPRVIVTHSYHDGYHRAYVATPTIERRILNIIMDRAGQPMESKRGQVIIYSPCEMDAGFIVTMSGCKVGADTQGWHVATLSKLVAFLFTAEVMPGGGFNDALAEYCDWEDSHVA